jgi:hypothetical protein
MDAGETRGQRRRVVGHDDVAFANERRKVSARTVLDRSPLIDDEQPAFGRSPDR